MRRAWPVAATGPSAKGMKQESPRLRSRVAAEAARRVQAPSRQSTMRGPVPGRASDGAGAATPARLDGPARPREPAGREAPTGTGEPVATDGPDGTVEPDGAVELSVLVEPGGLVEPGDGDELAGLERS